MIAEHHKWHKSVYCLATVLPLVLPQAQGWIDAALSSGGAVLVHCHEGKSRSVTLLVAYLMLNRGLTLAAALQHMRCAWQAPWLASTRPAKACLWACLPHRLNLYMRLWLRCRTYQVHPLQLWAETEISQAVYWLSYDVISASSINWNPNSAAATYVGRCAVPVFRSVQPKACPNAGFMAQLMRLDQSLHGTCSIQPSELPRAKPEARICSICGAPAGISYASLVRHTKAKHGLAKPPVAPALATTNAAAAGGSTV